MAKRPKKTDVSGAPRRLKNRADYSTRDPVEAAQLISLGCHLLVDEALCHDYGEWLFTGEEVPLEAVKLRLEPHELRWLAQRDRSRAPDTPLEHAPAIRTTGFCAAIYTGGLTDDEADDAWGMDGGPGRALDPDRLTTTWRGRETGGGVAMASAKRDVDAALCDPTIPHLDVCEEYEEQGFQYDDEEEREPPNVPTPWPLFLGGRAVLDKQRPDLAAQRRAYREREARAEAKEKAERERREKTMDYNTFWVTTERVAALLRIRRTAVQNWRKKHHVPVEKQGNHNTYRLEDVLEYATGQKLFGVPDVAVAQGA